MMEILANTAAGADPMISGEWLIKIIGAIFTGVALVLGRYWGRKEAANESSVTIKPPVPRLDVNTKEEPEFVTHGQLNGHLSRIEDTFEEIKEALNSERSIARLANGNIHKRIDALSERLGERLSSLEGKTDGVAQNVDKLLDIALNRKPAPRQ
jgi:hypothetical protein